jgi:hypothetical protein
MLKYLHLFASISFLFLIAQTASAQTMSIEGSITSLYLSDCSDCNSSADPYIKARVSTTIKPWSSEYKREQDNVGCNGTLNTNPGNYIQSGVATSENWWVQIRGFEDDSFICGGDDGVCDSYSGNQTDINILSNFAPACSGSYSTGSAQRTCTSGGTQTYTAQWQFRYHWDAGSLTNANAGGSITAPGVTTLCSGSDPANISGNSLLSNRFSSRQWEVSVNGGSYTSIGGATGQDYDPPTQIVSSTTTYTYRRRLSYCTNYSNGVTSVYSNTVTFTFVPPPTLGTLSNAGPINFCDASGNFGTALTVSGQTGTVVWDWGSNNGVWNNNWIVSNSSGTCCFPKKTSNSDGNADRIRYRVTNSPCSEVTSGTILIVNRYNEAPNSVTSSSNVYCSNSAPATITLTATFPANINMNGTVRFYSGSCGGTLVGTVTPAATSSTAAVTISAPASTTTYYARYEPGSGTGCNNTACVQTTVTVNSPSTAPSSVGGILAICNGGNTTLSVVGGSLGTGAQWVWYASSCGGSSIGTGSSIPVSPLTNTTYFVRAEGTCNTTTCASATVTIYGTTITSGGVGGSPALTQCSGGNPAAFVVSTPSGGNGSYTYQWQQSAGCSGTWTNATAENGITNTLNFDPPVLSLPTTSMCYRLQITDGCGSIGYSTTKTYTIVADPAAPTATKSPNVSTVCAGQTLTLTGVTDNGGGTGTCTIEYSHNGGAYTATLTPFAASVGTNTIAIRKSCTGTGCDNSAATTYTWTGVPDPSNPSLNTKTPNVASVCEGQSLSATFNPGTGGSGCSDEYQYRKNSGAWTNYTPGNPISTTTGDVSVEIQARRANCTAGIDCNEPAFAILASWTVSPDPSITATANTTICQGGTATLTASPANGIGCSIQWQDSPNGITFSNLTGETNASYTTAPLSATRYYKALYNCTGNDCGTAESNIITVTVTPDATITISSPADVCNGGSVILNVLSTTGGTGNCTYQWQVSNNGIAWNNLTGETNASYGSPALNTTQYYRCLYLCDGNGCDPANSNIEQINVQPDPAISISGAATICAENTATLNASASGGAASCNYQWQKSPDGISGWANVGSNSPNYTTDPLNTNSYYRCLYACSGAGCDPATSNVELITVNSLSVAPTGVSGILSICQGSNTTLTVVGGSLGTGAQWKWYSTSCGGTPEGTGTSININPASTTTYFVRAEGTCNQTTCAAATVVVNGNPTAANISGSATICAGNSTNLIVTVSGGTGPYTVVYTDGTNNFTVTPYTSGDNIPVTPATTTTYTLVSVTDNNACVVTGAALSGSATITVIPLNIAPTTINASATATCVGTTVTFSASGGLLAPGGTVVWYRSACAGALANGTVPASTGNPLTVTMPATPGTYKYYARYTGPCNNACSSAVFATVTVTAPASAAVLSLTGPSNVCPGGSSTIMVNITGGTAPFTLDINGHGTVSGYTSGSPITVTPPANTTYSLVSVLDANGCTAGGLAGTATVTVSDAVPPSISGCPSNIAVNAAANTCAANVSWTLPTANDNCSINSFTSSHNSGSSFAVGTTVVTYTATDGSGNTATCSFNVSVTDNQDPSISCPATVSVNTDAGTCTATGVVLGTPITNDNCGVATLVNDAPSSYPVGNTTVTWTVTDVNGRTATCSQTVSVADDQDPSISCPATVSVNTDAGTCTATGVALGTPITNDNCGVATVVNDAPSSYPVGNTTVTWTVTDVNGRTATCSQTVSVTDDQDPSISCPATVNVNTDAGTCTATGVVLGTPTTNDNCGVATLVNDAPMSYPVGNTTVTWTVTDVNGRTATCSQTVSVTDDQDPSISCPATVSVNTDAGTCTATGVALGTPITNDNCGVATVVNNAPMSYPVGNTTVTWTVTDVNGRTATCSQTVSVTDNQDPSISCPATVNVNTDAGTCTATGVALGTPITNDNCGVATLVNDAPSSYPVGNTTVTWTVTDVNGRTATCSQTVSVADNQDPSITCPATVNVNTDAGTCTATGVALGTPTTNDNCGVATLVNDAPSSYPVGNTAVTWTVTDVNGRTATCSQTVSVADNQDPSISCPATVSVNTDAGTCTATGVALGTPITNDNCGVATVVNDAPMSYPVGNTTVTWTVTDVNGRTATCSQTVSVADDQDPSITCPATVSVNTDAGTCTATGVALGTPITNDNCGVATLVNDAPMSYPVGNTTVTWTVTDVNGRTATCSQSVSVADNQDPSITCPATVSVNTDAGTCTATGVALGTPITNDNCGVATVVNDAPMSYPVGNTVVTWTVTDVNGRTATCSQTVSVADDQDPSISCPADIVSTTSADGMGDCSTVINGIALTASDNCAVANISWAATGALNATGSGDASGTTFPKGTTTVTYTATDSNGNTASCDFTVLIQDDEDPTLTCPSNASQTNDLGMCSAVVNGIDPSSAADNCNSVSLSYQFTGDTNASGTGSASGSTFNVGTTNVVYTLTDAAGNTASCSFQVFVSDDEAPLFNCPEVNNTIAANALCEAIHTLVPPIITDNCAIGTPAAFRGDGQNLTDPYPIGVTEIYWLVSDIHGNTADCKQRLIVVDAQAPTFVQCPLPNIQANADQGNCLATGIVPSPPSTNDDCTNAYVQGQRNDAMPLYDPYPIGTTTITWTMTDEGGNTATCQQLVVVSDTQAPQIECPSVNIYANNTIGLCNAQTVALQTPMAIDNCGTVTVDPAVRADALPLNAPYPLGSTTVTWTATDTHGNTASCTQNVIVIDAEPPAFDQCPVPALELNAGSGCSIVASINPPTGTDNCGTFNVGTPTRSDALTPADPYPAGNTTLTWTASDAAGNTVTCQQIITVIAANSAIAFDQCPMSNITASAGAGCTANPSISTPNATACGSPATITGTRSDGQNINDPYPTGTTTITWTANSPNGSTNCQQLVVVTENVPPTFDVCPLPNVTVNTQNGNCSAIYALSQPTASDLCGTPSITASRSDAQALGAPYSLGNTTVTWTATDAAGNTATCAQIVSVTDPTPPLFDTCPLNTINANADANCTANISLSTPTASDDCGTVNVSGSRNDALPLNDPYPIGNTAITWTATDQNGNIAVCTQNVLVADATPPQFAACPLPNINAASNGECSANLNPTVPTATDNCGAASVTGTRSDGQALNTPYPLGTTTITWQAIDAAGNISTCQQIVLVADTTPPTITCAANVSLNADPNTCLANTTLSTPSSSDNCSSTSISRTRSDAQPNNAPYPLGTTIVTWTATDAQGNTATCQQNVTVIDITPPTLVGVPSNTSIACPVPAAPTVTATDNCTATPSVAMTQTQTAGDCTTGYTITRTWVATDAAGNTSQQSQTINVTGAAPPLAITGAVITNGANGGVNISVAGGNCAGNYTYQWSNGATTQDISGVPGGAWYGVTVTCGVETVTAWYWVKSSNGRTKTNEQSTDNNLQIDIAPNPFADFTHITVKAETNKYIRIEVFDLNGQLVEHLFDGQIDANEANSIKFYAHNIPSGTYICQVKDKNGNKLQEKMIKVD